jgi:very-short-patch-repair endonuclease
VYALSHQPLTREGRWLAAVLACGPGAVLSHGDAAMHFELIPYEPGPVHVTVPRDSGGRSRPGIVVHRRDLGGGDSTVRDGIPVTIVTRTLLDLAPSLPRRSLERAIDEAIYLKKATESTLLGALERNVRRPGARAMRGALARYQSGTTRTETPLEELILALCRDHGLPEPICQAEILGYRVDFYWPRHKLIVETDGWVSHSDRRSFEEDRERDMILRAAGYRPPLRVTHRLLTRRPGAVAQSLRAEMG